MLRQRADVFRQRQQMERSMQEGERTHAARDGMGADGGLGGAGWRGGAGRASTELGSLARRRRRAFLLLPALAAVSWLFAERITGGMTSDLYAVPPKSSVVDSKSPRP
jgi:hypothetical protein